MNHFKNLALSFLTLLCVNVMFAQHERWTIQIDSANVFSSPRFTDLNGDKIKDVVLGGGIEAIPTPNGIIAIDGKNGELLWHIPTQTQTYTSALFQDVSGDGTDDVFIGGRAASFFAINGKTGEVIWEFFPTENGDPRLKGILNFYATQWIHDVDKDGFNDLLVANGGDYLAKPEDKNRKGAVLMVISAKTGKPIQTIPFPVQRETYYAPHIIEHGGKSTVIFGSGGETIDGGLWKIDLDALLENKMKYATEIVHDTLKGFILNSVVADINTDGEPDILNARMNAILTAIDGKTDKIIWEHSFPGYECYVTPSLGYFNDDDTPDFFTIIAKGTFPMYWEWRIIAIDGKTGNIIRDEVSGFNQFSPVVCADLNNDKIDEIIYIENKLLDPQNFLIVNQVKVLDLKNNRNYYIGPVRTGMSMASTPTLVDLDNDGNYEVVLSVTTMEGESEMAHSTIQCIDLDQEIKQLTWPGYLGANENGMFSK